MRQSNSLEEGGNGAKKYMWWTADVAAMNIDEGQAGWIAVVLGTYFMIPLMLD